MNNLFAGGAAIGIITVFWNYIKLIFNKCLNIFIVQMDIKNYNMKFAVKYYLINHFTCSPIGKKNYMGVNEYIRPLKRNALVGLESIPEQPTLWRKNKKFMLISMDEQSGGISISFIRGTFSSKQFIIDAVDEFNRSGGLHNEENERRFYVKRVIGNIGVKMQSSGEGQGSSMPEQATDSCGNDIRTSFPLKWTLDEIGQPQADNALDSLSLSQNILDAVDEAKTWKQSEEWFKDKGIPWKRGFLLHGKPGTCKTAFTRALGQELNVPIFSFDLATMSNQDFIMEWHKTISHTPCIVLFEDIDGVFDGRENIATHGMENGLTFDCFLNSIDGVENTDGMFIIITTNDISKIDSAIGLPSNGSPEESSMSSMSTRPGRIDRTIEFRTLDPAGREKMANRIFNGIPKHQWESILNDKHDDTGAQFQERCSRLAVKLFWENKK